MGRQVSGEGIKRLIPQRNPFIMVDSLQVEGEQCGMTGLAVRPDNYFVNPRGELAAVGLMEHIAQSAQALAGYWALEHGADRPPTGLIGEVKHYHCRRLPCTGERVETRIQFGLSFAGVTLATAESHVGGEQVAEAEMKIVLRG